MKKLFENWRAFQNEAVIGGQTLPSGQTIGTQTVDEPGAQPDASRDIKIKPLVKVMDSFVVGPEEYVAIMTKYDKSKPPDEHMLDFKTDNFNREKIKEAVQILLRSVEIGIDKDNISFNV